MVKRILSLIYWAFSDKLEKRKVTKVTTKQQINRSPKSHNTWYSAQVPSSEVQVPTLTSNGFTNNVAYLWKNE